jgi:hypothetical protein
MLFTIGQARRIRGRNSQGTTAKGRTFFDHAQLIVTTLRLAGIRITAR